MNKRELWEIFVEMIELLGERTLLNELFNALSSTELEEYLTYIANNYDLYEE